MKRKELISKAVELGFQGNAHSTKNAVLEQFIADNTPKEETTEEQVKPGRPVNPNSARQKRLRELAEKREAGLLKRGRPVVEDSERQKRLKELEEKRESGELIFTGKRGRPANPNSARQKRLAEIEAKKAAGIEIKRGRPSLKQQAENEKEIEKVKLAEGTMGFEFPEDFLADMN